MALISIPTSVAGINIPGRVFDGPLGKLFGNSYQQSIYHYPKDLFSSERGHAILFNIYQVQPVSLDTVKNSFSDISGAFQSALNNATGSIVNKAESAISGAASVAADKLGLKNLTTSTKINFNANVSKKPTGTIGLYIPENINFKYEMSYDTSLSMTQLVADKLNMITLGKLQGVINSVVGQGLVRGAINKAGYAVNPDQQVMFNGMNFREFQFNFIFSPTTQQEAADVDNIIKLFKSNALPTIQPDTFGMLYVQPNVFDISFGLNNGPNKKMPKIGKCVLKNIEVGYSPNGWAAHSDGTPVQTTLALTFQEIELLDRSSMESNNY